MNDVSFVVIKDVYDEINPNLYTINSELLC